MKYIRSIALIAFSLLTLAAWAQQGQQQGQPPQGPPPQGGDGPQGQRRGMPSVEEQIKHLTERLNLTSDQQTKIKPILEDSRQQSQALMKDDSVSQDDRRAKMRANRESTNAKIRDVLTDSQKKDFDTMQQEMRNRGGQRPGGGENQPPPKSDNPPPSK